MSDTVAPEPSRFRADVADYRFRQAVIAQLRQRADQFNREGDLAMLGPDLEKVHSTTASAARCVRSAQAIGSGKDFDPTDWPLIRAAYRAALSQQEATQ